MFEFNQKEKDLLEKIGLSGTGRDLIQLLKKIKHHTDKTSNIPDGSDYGAEVKGRAIATKIIDKLLEVMDKNPKKNFQNPEDLDDWS